MAGRRFSSKIPRLTGRAWEDVARELEEFLRRGADASNSGIPPGFCGSGGSGGGSGTAGNYIKDVYAGATPAAGTMNHGWAAVDHQHNALTDTAVDLTEQASSEGTGAPLARADHLHQMLLQAEGDNADLGTVSAVNIISPGLDVAIEPNLTGSLLTGLEYWPLDEVSGTRYSLNGVALTEVNSVSSAVGKFGTCARFVLASPTNRLTYASPAVPFTRKPGWTFAVWVKPDTTAQRTIAGKDDLGATREWSVNLRDTVCGFNVFNDAGTLTQAALTGIPLTTNRWVFVCVWIDAADNIPRVRVDDIEASASSAISGAYSTDKAVDFVLGGTTAFGNAWSGDIDAPMLWASRALTAAERERLWLSRRATVSLAGDVRVIDTVANGGGTVVTPGVMGYAVAPYDGEIVGWNIVSEQSGDIVFDVWKNAWGDGSLPTNADSITGVGKPALSGGFKARSSDMSGWTDTTVAEGDILAFEVETASSIIKATLQLLVQKSG